MLPVPRFRLSALATRIALLGLMVVPALCRADDLPPLRSSQPPYFSADVAVTVDSLTHPSVSVTITLPYAELNWNKLASGFAAGAGFTVELEPEKRDRLYGGTWEKRLLIESYSATHSSRNNIVFARSVDIPPGRYRVRVHVRDVSSEQESSVEDVLVLEDLARVPVGFADLQIGVLDSTGAFVPVPTRRFGGESERIAARVTTFDRRPGEWPRRASLRWRVLDEGSNVDASGDTALVLTQPTQSVIVHPAKADLFIGRYSFEVERIEAKSRWRTGRSFEIEESGPPHGREFTTLLEALAYIASAEEVDAMRNLTPEQQAAAWERFWRRRDPTPETARNEFQIEFFRRLRYAEQHFQGFGPGWRSDMGRIYIRYGPPDQVEQHPASTVTPQQEIWFYNQPYHRFVFLDREGFGRYTLASPTLE